MATVTAKHDPFPTRDTSCGTEVTRHVARRLDDEQAPVAEKVHCLLERAKGDPRPFELFPVLRRALWVEESPVPLYGRILKVAGRTELLCSRTKVRRSVWKQLVDGPTMVPVRMTGSLSAFDTRGLSSQPLPE